MKQMQRLLYEGVSLAMAVLFVLPFGAFFEQFFSFPIWRTAFLPCFAVLGYLVGRATLHTSINAAMGACVGSVAAAMILTAGFLPSFGLGGIVYELLVLVLAAFFFFAARKSGYAVYAPMAIGGILSHLVIILAANFRHVPIQTERLISIAACAFFLLSLYALNSSSLRNSLHKGIGVRNIRYPSGIRMGNFWLLTGFILAALVVSNIYPLFQGFSTVFVGAVKLVARAFGFISSLFDRRSVPTAVEEESSSEPVSEEDNLFAYEAKGESPAVTFVVQIFAMICVAILLAYLLYKGIRYLKSHLKGMGGLVGRFRKLFVLPEELDYVDEEESLFSWKAFWDHTRDSLRKNAQKLRERPQRFDDFPDDRLKIRFVYKQLLKGLVSRVPGCVYRTPNELMAQELDNDEDVTEFIAAYNGVKYAGEAPPESSVSAAKRLLKRKF